jgi:hypothetical protein
MINSAVEMSQKIRVKIEPKYKDIYNSLKNVAVGDFHELFFLCVCLGKKAGKKTSLERKEDCFWSSTIVPDEWYSYYGIFLHDNGIDLSSLTGDTAVLNVMQEYANAGMQVLLDEFLHVYVKQDKDGKYIVDSTEEVSKDLLAAVVTDWS